MSGRLGDSIRERQGMAYYVYSSFDGNVVAGPLVVRAGVSAANVDKTAAQTDDDAGNAAVAHQQVRTDADYSDGDIGRQRRQERG